MYLILQSQFKCHLLDFNGDKQWGELSEILAYTVYTLEHHKV